MKYKQHPYSSACTKRRVFGVHRFRHCKILKKKNIPTDCLATTRQVLPVFRDGYVNILTGLRFFKSWICQMSLKKWFKKL